MAQTVTRRGRRFRDHPFVPQNGSNGRYSHAVEDSRPLGAPRPPAPRRQIIFGDNLETLRRIPDNTFALIYVDPPFNTNRRQARTRLRTVRDRNGDRAGFGGNRYRTVRLGTTGFDDRYDDYPGFLRPRLEEARRVLTATGSFFLHADFREVHYAKVLLDEIFGRDSFVNEIIWAYDYGARSKSRWSPKHDNLLWYAKDPDHYTFHYDEIDRIPYLAPTLVGAEKAARGKTPTDVWWHTIVSPTGKERTGYATQKPLGVLERIVRVHSDPGDLLLDFFAGSGSFGEAAARNRRDFVLVDNNSDAVRIMADRLGRFGPDLINCGGVVERSVSQPQLL
ncbi:MAG: site-specific DNA-methyltransferase [Acidobacteria bacterium]|nr:site-specific DNA-methyltransferase [Acidobacteriota bacterium]